MTKLNAEICAERIRHAICLVKGSILLPAELSCLRWPLPWQEKQNPGDALKSFAFLKTSEWNWVTGSKGNMFTSRALYNWTSKQDVAYYYFTLVHLGVGEHRHYVLLKVLWVLPKVLFNLYSSDTFFFSVGARICPFLPCLSLNNVSCFDYLLSPRPKQFKEFLSYASERWRTSSSLGTRNWGIMDLFAGKDTLAICIKLAQNKKMRGEIWKGNQIIKHSKHPIHSTVQGKSATRYSKRCIQKSKASGWRIWKD